MYLEHFGLKRTVFDEGVAQKSDVYVGARQKLIEANIKIALSTRDSVIVFGGRAGVGKTTLSAHSLRNALPSVALGWIGTPPSTPEELLKQMLASFRVKTAATDETDRLYAWRDFLTETCAAGKRVCVLIESAQDLSVDVLQYLDSMTASDPTGCPGANVILTTRLSLSEKMGQAELESLLQRVRLSCWLDPMDEQALLEYMQHRLVLAGGAASTIFSDRAIAAIFAYSKGVTRVINNLCETLLTVAATRKDKRVTSSLVSRVAVGVLGMTPLPGGNTQATTSQRKIVKPKAVGIDESSPQRAPRDAGQTAIRQATAQTAIRAAAPQAAAPSADSTASSVAIRPNAEKPVKSAAEAIAEATGERSALNSIFDLILPSDLPGG